MNKLFVAIGIDGEGFWPNAVPVMAPSVETAIGYFLEENVPKCYHKAMLGDYGFGWVIRLVAKPKIDVSSAYRTIGNGGTFR